MIPTMHDLLAAYPVLLAERREPRRTRPVKFRPVPFRPLAPEHGQFVARLLVPTRRQRLVAWWREHRQALAVNALLTVAFLAAFVAFGLVVDRANALADWVDQL